MIVHNRDGNIAASVMPFMKGLAPIRRTVAYLEKGNIVLKDRVKIVAVHFCTKRKQTNHHGTK